MTETDMQHYNVPDIPVWHAKYIPRMSEFCMESKLRDVTVLKNMYDTFAGYISGSR